MRWSGRPWPAGRFENRADAGIALARRLSAEDLQEPLLLGLARGGVVVAAAAADVLGAPLDVLVVRKVGHPGQPELGMGAVAEDGTVVYDDEGLTAAGLSREDLAGTLALEQTECARRVAVYRSGRPPLPLAGRTVVVVDDGVATGGTALAALRSVAARGAARRVLATPVASHSAVGKLRQEADAVVSLLVPTAFGAVSRWYADFDQTQDDEVVRLLSPRAPRSR